jgi:hypothetical protein
MRYIITESRLTSIIENWLSDNYGNLISAVAGGYRLYVPSKDDMTVIFSVSPNSEVLIMNKKIFNSMVDLFGIEKEGVSRGFIIKWFNKNYNQKVERFRIEHHSEDYIFH